MMWIRTDAYFLISLVQVHWRKIKRIKLGVCFLLHICLLATESWAGQKLMGCGGWSCFWDALFPCSGLTKGANDCPCAEPCMGCPAPLSPRSRGDSSRPAPFLAPFLHVQGDVLAAEALLSSWTLSGSWGKAGATWKYPMSVGCQLDHCE